MRTGTGFVLLLFLMMSACEQVEETPIENPGPEFFPLQTGSFIIYNVDSVRILQNIESSFSFQLRVSVGKSFVNGEGTTTYVLQREKRADASKPWTPAGTWSAWKSPRQAVVNEGSISYIKLQFPATSGISWNGNALNSKGGDERCNGIDCDRYDVTKSESDSIVVTLNDEPDLIVKTDIRTEIYVKDIGLTQKESKVLVYCTEPPCPTDQFVIDGLRYKQVMIEHGSL